jgi:hypothetical protein
MTGAGRSQTSQFASMQTKSAVRRMGAIWVVARCCRKRPGIKRGPYEDVGVWSDSGTQVAWPMVS